MSFDSHQSGGGHEHRTDRLLLRAISLARGRRGNHEDALRAEALARMPWTRRAPLNDEGRAKALSYSLAAGDDRTAVRVVAAFYLAFGPSG